MLIIQFLTGLIDVWGLKIKVPKEKEILVFIIDGFSNEEMAKKIKDDVIKILVPRTKARLPKELHGLFNDNIVAKMCILEMNPVKMSIAHI